MIFSALFFLSLVVLPSPAADDADELPAAGQPEHFSGAIGTFRAAAHLEPTEVQAEDPFTFTLRITAVGSFKKPPRRPRLGDFPAFKDSFYLENLEPLDGVRPDATTWEFSYRLKPKSTDVKIVPGLPFSYYKPGVVPARLGYRTAYTSEIPITVRARVPVDVIPSGARPFDVPEATFHLAPADAVPEGSAQRLPAWPVLLGLFGIPPLGCLLWYLTWRIRFPQEASQLLKRRSRAATEALAALQRLGRRDENEQARAAALLVARYLCHRWDLSSEQATPGEVSLHLQRQGLPGEVAKRATDFFRICDAVRFAPGATAPSRLPDVAADLIVLLEEMQCPQSC